jgi:uncharacterized protein DUF1501
LSAGAVTLAARLTPRTTGLAVTTTRADLPVWLADSGFKSGVSVGSTDEFGHLAVEGKVRVHDLHFTSLHQLELDQERLTFRYSGRGFRLTDMSGSVVSEAIDA